MPQDQQVAERRAQRRVIPGGADAADVSDLRVLAVHTRPYLHDDRSHAARGIAPPVAQRPQGRLGRRRDAHTGASQCSLTLLASAPPRVSSASYTGAGRRAAIRVSALCTCYVPDCGGLGGSGKAGRRGECQWWLRTRWHASGTGEAACPFRAASSRAASRSSALVTGNHLREPSDSRPALAGTQGWR